jgi:hypothetical protein
MWCLINAEPSWQVMWQTLTTSFMKGICKWSQKFWQVFRSSETLQNEDFKPTTSVLCIVAISCTLCNTTAIARLISNSWQRIPYSSTHRRQKRIQSNL